MNEQDKAAFEAFKKSKGDEVIRLAETWQAALQHRDSQPMVRLTEEETANLEALHIRVYRNENEARVEGVEDYTNAIMDALEAKNRGQG